MHRCKEYVELSGQHYMGGNHQHLLKLKSSQQCLTHLSALEEGIVLRYRQLQDCYLNPQLTYQALLEW